MVFNKREKTYLIDTFLKKKYWFYLRDAINVHEGSILTSERVYTVFTYVNIVGTFLAIGSCDNENKITINTFVRLGTGAASTKKIEPIELAPVLIELG